MWDNRRVFYEETDFALIVAVSFLLSLLTGCTPNDIPSSQNPVTLSMWHVYGSQTQSPLNTAIEEFNNTVGKENGHRRQCGIYHQFLCH